MTLPDIWKQTLVALVLVLGPGAASAQGPCGDPNSIYCGYFSDQRQQQALEVQRERNRILQEQHEQNALRRLDEIRLQLMRPEPQHVSPSLYLPRTW